MLCATNICDMKSVLFLILSLQPRGAERALVNLVNGIDKSRCKVTVQSLFDVGELRGELDSEVIYQPGLPWLVRGNTHLLKLLTPKWAYHLIVGRRYDVVVSFLEGAAMRIVSGCPFTDVRKLAWIHVEQQSRKNAAYCYRSEREMVSCYLKYDNVACVAESVKEELCQLMPELEKKRVCVIHNVTDEDRIRRRSNEPLPAGEMVDNGFRLLSSGALNGVKGFDRLIRVHRQLLDANILNHLYILGRGPEYKKLCQLIQALKVEETVHLLGHQENPYPYVKQADLYVCASKQEGFSTAVTEALILGIPVVSTNCSGARELLGEKDQFGIITENDENALLMGVERILTQPGLLDYYRGQSEKRGKKISKQTALEEAQSFIFL